MPRTMTITWRHDNPELLSHFELRTGPATMETSVVGVVMRVVRLPGQPEESSTDEHATFLPDGRFQVTVPIPNHDSDPTRLRHDHATVDAVNVDRRIKTRVAPIQIELPPPPAPPAPAVIDIAAVAVDDAPVS